ncbi:MAG TPA: di-heme oxidoredictase family protein [Candidatus Acidoferrales bacterium]|nr:di-heme oxidoredictase family protein [Candidatus Acidoferrales bacterium]
MPLFRSSGVFELARRSKVKLCLAFLMVLLISSIAFGQLTAKDPGVRGGDPGVGGPRPGLVSNYPQLFAAALLRFQEVNCVSGSLTGCDSQGLGPRFNGDGCAGCHVQPTVGGTSPATNNPQIGFATVFGAQNVVPPFIQSDGPIREARFIRNPDGSPDGGVHDLFTITKMQDAAGCTLTQPNFEQALDQHNVIFRIPTPVFGMGMVEEITDSNLLANAAANQFEKNILGIRGHPNRSGNDGSITRFGWKAQNKSALIFAGEAYNVEMGVTSELFPNEREDSHGCLLTQLPEDAENFTSSGPSPTSDMASDVSNFAMFMRLSAPPTPATPTPSSQRGANVFTAVGCALCHSPSISTGSMSLTTGQTNVPVNAFSDFMVHHMGAGLADGVSQGSAGPDEFRTAPLWGLGQRVFFLHDGRTSDLLEAIRAHHSPGSEANAVITRFHGLTETQKQDLLNFLRSL